ncbi:hypothetical protein H8D30_05440 [bacterium]|nr:hypothetical protein [bacterium]
MKTRIPVLTAFLLGLFMWMAYFVDKDAETGVTWVRVFYEELNQNNIVIAVFTLYLGVMTLLLRHAKKIRDKRDGRFFSLVVILSALGMVAIGLFMTGDAGLGENIRFQWAFDYLQVPLSATMFSLLAFFVASAAYRAFRARSPEATLMLVAAALVMLARVPLGAAIHEALPEWGDWIMDIPNLAGKRAITMGVGLGMTATAIKIVFGIERTYMGSGGK